MLIYKLLSLLWCTGLPCLQVLDLAENALQSLEGLGDLPALTSLNVSSNRLCRSINSQSLTYFLVNPFLIATLRRLHSLRNTRAGCAD